MRAKDRFKDGRLFDCGFPSFCWDLLRLVLDLVDTAHLPADIGELAARVDTLTGLLLGAGGAVLGIYLWASLWPDNKATRILSMMAHIHRTESRKFQRQQVTSKISAIVFNKGPSARASDEAEEKTRLYKQRLRDMGLAPTLGRDGPDQWCSYIDRARVHIEEGGLRAARAWTKERNARKKT